MGDLATPEIFELLLIVISGLVLVFLGRVLNWSNTLGIQLCFGIVATLTSVLSFVLDDSSAILSVVLLFLGISFLERAWELHRSEVNTNSPEE